MKTIKLAADKTSYILLIIICLVCAALGVTISFNFHLIAGLFISLVFVLITSSFAWLWKFESKPQLIIDDTGIHAHRSPAGFIPWDDIEDGTIKYISGGKLVSQPILCLFLHDPEPYLQRYSRFRRPFMKFNSFTGFADINITLFGLKGADPEEIQAVIRSRMSG